MPGPPTIVVSKASGSVRTFVGAMVPKAATPLSSPFTLAAGSRSRPQACTPVSWPTGVRDAGLRRVLTRGLRRQPTPSGGSRRARRGHPRRGGLSAVAGLRRCQRIGVWGICAGRGYAVNATSEPPGGGAGTPRVSTRTRGLTLAAAAQQRTAEAQGAEAAFSPYVPAEPDENTPIRPGAGQGLLPDTACSASERQE
jgi:hypothetical protein